MASRSLWNKIWMETRWRFVIGVVMLTLLAGAKVFEWVATSRLMPQIDAAIVSSNASGVMGAVIRDALEAQKDFRGFIWYRGFRDNLSGIGVIFAILLGCGGLVSESAKGSVLFTLSLPVTRRDLFNARAFVGLVQCLALAMVPPLMIPILAPAIGQQFAFVDALALACGAALASYVIPQVDVFSVMNGAQYYRTGALPWTGLLASAVVATALLYSAAETLERRDF